MTIELDFSKLRGPDVLDMAIAIEDEATIYYEQLADWTGNDKPEVADFFKRMAVRERRHHDQIVAQRERLFPDAPKSHAEKVSWAVEAPDYDAIPTTSPCAKLSMWRWRPKPVRMISTPALLIMRATTESPSSSRASARQRKITSGCSATKWRSISVSAKHGFCPVAPELGVRN